MLSRLREGNPSALMRSTLQPTFILGIYLLSAPSLFAQEVKPPRPAPQSVEDETNFTRLQAIQFALRHSPLLGAAQERIAAAQGNLQSAGAVPPAEVNVGPTFGGNVGLTPILTQTLEISGKRGARSGVARGELTATQRESEVTRLDIVRNVSQAYYTLAQSQQAETLYREVTEIVRRTRDSVKLQVEKGQLPTQDLIKAETELARAEADLLRAQTLVFTNQITLNTVMGKPISSLTLASEPVSLVPLTSEQPALITQALAHRPELAVAEARVVTAQQNIRLQQSNSRPDLAVSLLQNTSVGSSDFLSPRSTGIGIGLVFPLFDTGRIRGRVRQAEAQVREQERLRDQTRLEVQRDVGVAFAQVKVTETLIRRYEQAILPNAQDLLKKAQFGYERGGTTLLEYLEAQRTYRNTRTEYLGILGDNARARAELDRAVGMPYK